MRISFLTPDIEVYVDAPVKFIVRNDAAAGIISTQATVSRPGCMSLSSESAAATSRPAVKPLNEKLLPGSHGRRSGPIITPAMDAAMTINTIRMPFPAARRLE